MTEQDNLPRWTGERGVYEVWFLTMSAADGRRGYWIRYTVRAPSEGRADPRVWFARVDRDDPAKTFGINAGFPGTFRSASDRFEIRIGDSALGSGRASGHLEGAGHDVSWDLGFDGDEPTYRLLPRPFYRGGLVPTKPYTPNPDVRFGGRIEVDGEAADLEGVRGQQGHLFGTRHAERWAWAFSNAFAGSDAVFQAISAASRRGPIRTPLLVFAGLRHEGRWRRFRGLRGGEWNLGRWRLDLRSRRYRLRGEIRAEPEEMVKTRYADPNGDPRWCHNSVVASSRLTFAERSRSGWRDVAELVSDGTTHAEWAGRTPAADVEATHVEVP